MSLLSFFLSSCAVTMASNRGGAGIDSIQKAIYREDLLALGARPIETHSLENGTEIETFLVQKEHGSVARALMHGLLDLGTAFLWEFAGTPIEATLNEPVFYTVKVTFDDMRKVQKIELL